MLHFVVESASLVIPLAFIAVLLSMPSPASTLEADSVKSVDAHTVTVFAAPCEEACFTGVPSTSTLTVDELMSNGSAMLIRRAAIAGEAMVGGLRGAQVALTIDGMKVHSACIDKMDPATAYVELDNLETLELTSGSGDLRYGSNLGGALSFQLRHPSATAPLAARVSMLFDANSLGRTVKTSVEGSVDSIGLRAAYTYRAADDFRAGGDETV